MAALFPFLALARSRRWHVSTFPPLVPAAGTSRPSRRWCPPLARLDLPAAGARRWHVSTFPPLARSPAAGTFSGRWCPPLVPAAGTSRPSRRWCPPLARLDLPGRWCPPLARLDLPAAGARRWHVPRPLVPGRWCPAQSPAAGTFPAAGKQFPSYYLTLPLLCRKLNYSRETN